MINRRTALAGCAALAIRGVAAQPSLESFPSRPIALVVPFAAGGPTDALARALADALRPRLGQPVIVDNRPGAGGAIASEFVARAAPDGHTLLMGGSSLTILPALAKSAVDPVADFTAISQVLTLEIFLLARADLPVRNLKELVACAKANPGKLTYGSAGSGSVTHMQMELLKSMAGIHVLHIPYRGTAPALQDLLGGRIDLLFDSFITAGSHIRSGLLRALAVAAPMRSRAYPDVPTMAEAGLSGYDATGWSGVLGPARMPYPLVQRLNREVVAATQDPAFQKRLEAVGAAAASTTPEQYEQRIQTETARWTALARQRGLKLD